MFGAPNKVAATSTDRSRNQSLKQSAHWSGHGDAARREESVGHNAQDELQLYLEDRDDN